MPWPASLSPLRPVQGDCSDDPLRTAGADGEQMGDLLVVEDRNAVAIDLSLQAFAHERLVLGPALVARSAGSWSVL